MRKLYRIYVIENSDGLGMLWLYSTIVALCLSNTKVAMVLAVQAVYITYRLWRIYKIEKYIAESNIHHEVLTLYDDTVCSASSHVSYKVSLVIAVISLCATSLVIR